MNFKERSGRRGEGTEYYEFAFKQVSIAAQKSGKYWYVYFVPKGNGGVFMPKGQTEFTKEGAIAFARTVAEKYSRGQYIAREA